MQIISNHNTELLNPFEDLFIYYLFISPNAITPKNFIHLFCSLIYSLFACDAIPYFTITQKCLKNII